MTYIVCCSNESSVDVWSRGSTAAIPAIAETASTPIIWFPGLRRITQEIEIRQGASATARPKESRSQSSAPPAIAAPLCLSDLDLRLDLSLGHHVDLELTRFHGVAQGDSGGVESPWTKRGAISEPQPQHSAPARRER